MIIINLTGGLGNQMFQYAFGRYLSLKSKTELKYNFTNALFNIQRSFELNVFNISATEASSVDLKRFGVIQSRVINRLLYLLDERYGIQFNERIVTQKYPYTFDPIYKNIGNELYVQGYWANERFFNSIESTLRKDFTLKEELDKKNQNILKQIQKQVSVSVHVRRTDYITNKTNMLKFIGLEYYINSIEKLKKSIFNPVFFVFSDDIPWCKKNLNTVSNNIHYIDHNTGKNSYKDLILMSACQHNIIANSTFSWWGSWLNQNKNKIIIKPINFIEDSR